MMPHQQIPTHYNGLTVVMVDAGQGDTTLIRYPTGELLVVDCGSTKKFQGAVAGEVQKVINTYTGQHGSKIDWLVLTHPDEDHYSMVKPAIIDQNITVDRVFYGGDAKGYKSGGGAVANWLRKKAGVSNPPGQVEDLQPNQSIGGRGNRKRKTTGNVGGYSDLIHQSSRPDRSNPILSKGSVKAWILAANVGTSPNPKSIVLLLEYQGVKVFLMGDATTETEQFILDTYNAPSLAQAKRSNSTLRSLLGGTKVALKLGHHGSSTSSGTAWLSQLRPKALLVSAAPQGFGRTPKTNDEPTGMPRRTVIQAASTHLATGATSHDYMAFDDTGSPKQFKTFTTTHWIYSTTRGYDLSNANNPLNIGQSIYYMISSSGDPEVHATS